MHNVRVAHMYYTDTLSFTDTQIHVHVHIYITNITWWSQWGYDEDDNWVCHLHCHVVVWNEGHALIKIGGSKSELCVCVCVCVCTLSAGRS